MTTLLYSDSCTCKTPPEVIVHTGFNLMARDIHYLLETLCCHSGEIFAIIVMPGSFLKESDFAMTMALTGHAGLHTGFISGGGKSRR